MGYNTVLLIHNDSLGAIRQDLSKWWAQVEQHSQVFRFPARPLEQSAGSDCNASQVVVVQHADYHSLIAAGGNYGSVLGQWWVGNRGHHTKEQQIELLTMAAATLGYDLVPHGGI